MQFRHPRAVVLLFIGIIVVMQAAFWLLPRRSFSENEKRVLSEAPQIDAAGIADGSVFRSIESYLSDHFPGASCGSGANAYLENVEGRGATEDIVRGTDGWLFTAPVSDDRETLWDNMQAITTFAEKQSVAVSMMAVPSAGAVVSDKLPALHMPYPDARSAGGGKADCGQYPALGGSVHGFLQRGAAGKAVLPHRSSLDERGGIPRLLPADGGTGAVFGSA